MWKYILVLSLALCSCGSQYQSSVEQNKEKYYSQLDCENCDEID